MQGLIGQELGGYRIISQVGKGGMATVFKAFQPSLDRYVAVKVMPPYYAEQDETFLKRFRQEAKAIANLRHPNILMVIDYGEQEGTTFLVMEYVESGTLSDPMGSPLAPSRMQVVVEQVAGALQYAHSEGVVHRDVKPSNILMPKPDWLLLTDFGLAKIVGGSQLTQTGTVAGTPAYMSPEQGQGEKVDARSDIYSLGVVLYEMATGVVPFQAETPMAVVVKHIIDPLPLPRSKNPDLPESIERVILKALTKEPDDRYQSAAEMATALTEAVSALPIEVAAAAADLSAAQATTLEASEVVKAAVEAAPAPSEVPDQRPRRRIPTAALIGAGALAVAAIAFGASRLFGSDGSTEPEQDRTVEQIVADSRASLEQGDPGAAIEDLQQAIEADPQNMDLRADLARAFIMLGEPENARAVIQQGVELTPDEAWVHELAGNVYEELGLTNEAIGAYRRALELDPELYWLYYSIADAHKRAGRPGQAAAVLFEALENPIIASDPNEIDSLGWYFVELDMLREAEQAFQRAIEANPDFPSPWEGLAEVAYRRNNLEAGLNVIRDGIEHFPDHPPFYETAGYWFWELGDYEQALAAFEQAAQLDPSNSYAYASMANLLVELGREQEAIELLSTGLEAFPEEPSFYGDLAGMYASLGRPEEAIPLYEAVIEMQPLEGWWHAYLGHVYVDLGDLDRAYELLARAAELNQGDPWLAELIGYSYLAAGECDLAVENFEHAIAIDPTIDSARQGIRECGG